MMQPMDTSAGGVSIETHLALINQRLDQLVQISDNRGSDHEQRLRALEQFKWLMMGAAAAAGAVAGYVVELVRR